MQDPELPSSNPVAEKLLNEVMLAIARVSVALAQTNARIAYSRHVIEHSDGAMAPESRAGSNDPNPAPHPID